MSNNLNEDLSNPHDKLFKTVFSDPKEARSFFQSYLPETLVSTIDWSSLILIDKEFIDEDFKSSESDLLYQAQLKEGKQEIQMYLLFEHQSKPDKWLRFRLLKYCCRIWDESFKADPNQQILKPIVPIVFYQGKYPWKYGTELLDLIEHKGMNDALKLLACQLICKNEFAEHRPVNLPAAPYNIPSKRANNTPKSQGVFSKCIMTEVIGVYCFSAPTLK